MRRSQFLIVSFAFFILCVAAPIQSFAQVDFFGTPEQKNQPTARPSQPANTNCGKAKIIFFLAPGCHSCAEEAAKLERELSSLGWKYEIEAYLSEIPASW
jgi:hypothetical protein